MCYPPHCPTNGSWVNHNFSQMEGGKQRRKSKIQISKRSFHGTLHTTYKCQIKFCPPCSRLLHMWRGWPLSDVVFHVILLVLFSPQEIKQEIPFPLIKMNKKCFKTTYLKLK